MTDFGHGYTRRYNSHSRDCLCDGCIGAFIQHNRDGMCECGFCQEQSSYAHIRNAKLRSALNRYMYLVRARTAALEPWPEWYGRERAKEPSGRAPKVHRHGPGCAFGDDCNNGKINNNIYTEAKVSSINLCDRHKCGAMSKNNVMGMLVLIPNVGGPENVYADAVHTTHRDTKRLELCPGCVGELMEWIEEVPVHTPNGKGYTEPWKAAPKGTPERIADIIEKMGSQELMRLALEASDKEAGIAELDDDQ